MTAKRAGNDAIFTLTAQLSEKIKQCSKTLDSQSNETKKSIATISKLTASNLATIRRQTQHFASSDASVVKSVLVEKLRGLEEELNRRTNELKEINDSIDELDNEWNEIAAQTARIEQEVLEKRRALDELRTRSEAALKKTELQVELMQALTGLHLSGDGNFDSAAVIGYDSESGEPLMKFLSYSENSTSDELEVVNKAWAAVEALSGSPK